MGVVHFCISNENVGCRVRECALIGSVFPMRTEEGEYIRRCT